MRLERPYFFSKDFRFKTKHLNNPRPADNSIIQGDIFKKKDSPSNDSEIDKKYFNRTMSIWNQIYKKGKHERAKRKFATLLTEARNQGISGERDAFISFFLSFSIYHDDRKKRVENTAHTIAKEAREKTKNHRTLSYLYQVEGLSHFQNGNKEEAQKLLNLSHKEALASGDDNTVGATLNGLGINLNNEKMYSDAVKFLEDAVKYHKSARDKVKPDIREANAQNNLIVSYTERGKKAVGHMVKLHYLNMAEKAADEALRLYNNPRLHHSFRTRDKLATALITLGSDERHFNKAIKLLETQQCLRNEESQRLSQCLRNKESQSGHSKKEKNDEFNTKDQKKIDDLVTRIQTLQ